MFLDDLRFSLNATMPVFLMMVFGYICRRIGLLDEHTTAKLNKFTFRTLLPALLFADLSKADFRTVWDSRFVLFCVGATLLSILTAGAYSLLHKDKAERGEIIQASYRSSAAVLGIAFVRNIYGDSLMAALMVLGTVSLYNIAAVTVLSLTSPDRKKDGSRSLALDQNFIDHLRVDGEITAQRDDFHMLAAEFGDFRDDGRKIQNAVAEGASQTVCAKTDFHDNSFVLDYLETTEYTEYTDFSQKASQTSAMMLITLCKHDMKDCYRSRWPPSARRFESAYAGKKLTTSH